MKPGEALKPICVIYGQATFLRREALKRIVDRELGDGDPALNLSRLDGEKLTAAEALDGVRTFSLLGGRRVVIVENADGFISANRALLERYVESPSDSGCLVLIANQFDGRTKLYKSASKVGELVDCKPAKGRALLNWIMQRAQSHHNKRVAQHAATSLVDHAGTSQEGLDHELAKLSLYVGARGEITAKDVGDLVGQYREQTVFAVMDAISAGDVRAALNEWQQVVSTDRAAQGRAIGGLAWGVRRLLDARQRIDAGESPHAVARSFWAEPDAFARRMQRMTVRRCETQLHDLLEADLDAKTGGATVNSAIEKFIVKHSLLAAS